MEGCPCQGLACSRIHFANGHVSRRILHDDHVTHNRDICLHAFCHNLAIRIHGVSVFVDGDDGISVLISAVLLDGDGGGEAVLVIQDGLPVLVDIMCAGDVPVIVHGELDALAVTVAFRCFFLMVDICVSRGKLPCNDMFFLAGSPCVDLGLCAVRSLLIKDAFRTFHFLPGEIRLSEQDFGLGILHPYQRGHSGLRIGDREHHVIRPLIAFRRLNLVQVILLPGKKLLRDGHAVCFCRKHQLLAFQDKSVMLCGWDLCIGDSLHLVLPRIQDGKLSAAYGVPVCICFQDPYLNRLILDDDDIAAHRDLGLYLCCQDRPVSIHDIPIMVDRNCFAFQGISTIPVHRDLGRVSVLIIQDGFSVLIHVMGACYIAFLIDREYYVYAVAIAFRRFLLAVEVGLSRNQLASDRMLGGTGYPRLDERGAFLPVLIQGTCRSCYFIACKILLAERDAVILPLISHDRFHPLAIMADSELHVFRWQIAFRRRHFMQPVGVVRF